MQTRRAEALPGFRLASPLHEIKRHPAKRRVSNCVEALAQPKAEATQAIFIDGHLTNRVKIPLCQTRSPQFLQKSLSAIATIPLNIKTVFSPSQTVSGKMALTPR